VSQTSVTLPFEFGLDFADLNADLFRNFGFNIDAGEGIQFNLFWDLRLGFGATLGNSETGVEPGFFINSGAIDRFGDDVEELRAGVEVFSAGWRQERPRAAALHSGVPAAYVNMSRINLEGV